MADPHAWEALAADLDRCSHGRHEGDACYGCPNGISSGNPFRQGAPDRPLVEDVDGAPYPDRTIGFTISGRPIIDPGRRNRHDPRAWLWEHDENWPPRREG